MLIWLEHLNLVTDSSEWTRIFYIAGLGAPRDARPASKTTTYHVNAGMNQFHLLGVAPPAFASKTPQVLNGVIGLYYPSLVDLEDRLVGVKEELKDSRFEYCWDDSKTVVFVTGPFGNKFECRQTPGDFLLQLQSLGSNHPCENSVDSLPDGITFVKLSCPVGSASGIGRFYSHYFGAATAVCDSSSEETTVRVSIGPLQQLIFQEDKEMTEVCNHEYHICVYLDNFKESYDKLAKDNLIWNNLAFRDRCDTWEAASAGNQYRILDIVDPSLCNDSSTVVVPLMKLEHEVRSQLHPRCPLSK